MLTVLEIGIEAKVPLNLLFNSLDLLSLGELEDGLGVVGHWAVAIDGDVHRSHAEEAEGDEAEGENGGVWTHDGLQAKLRVLLAAEAADVIGAGHQSGDEHPL